MSGTFLKCIISIALKGDLVEVSKNSIFFFTLFLTGAGRGDEKTMQNWKKKSDYLRSFIILQTCHSHCSENKCETYGLG